MIKRKEESSRKCKRSREKEKKKKKIDGPASATQKQRP
jgi:hypothetical protein